MSRPVGKIDREIIRWYHQMAIIRRQSSDGNHQTANRRWRLSCNSIRIALGIFSLQYHQIQYQDRQSGEISQRENHASIFSPPDFLPEEVPVVCQILCQFVRLIGRKLGHEHLLWLICPPNGPPLNLSAAFVARMAADLSAQ